MGNTQCWERPYNQGTLQWALLCSGRRRTYSPPDCHSQLCTYNLGNSSTIGCCGCSHCSVSLSAYLVGIYVLFPSRISWSVTDHSWANTITNDDVPVVSDSEHEFATCSLRPPQLRMSTLPDTQENALPPTVWNLKPVQSAANVAGKIIPGLYSLQSVACDNFVGLSNDEETIACWPSSHFSKSGTRLVNFSASDHRVALTHLMPVGDCCFGRWLHDSSPGYRQILYCADWYWKRACCIPFQYPCGMEDQAFVSWCSFW